MRSSIKSFLIWLWSVVGRDARPKVVFYHDVGREWTSMGTPETMFWRHMKCLRAGDIVCFDDGFRGVWECRDKFKSLGIRPKIFVAPRLIGEHGHLSWNELRVLQKDFGFDVQSHTWSHQTLVGPMIDESPREDRTEQWYHRELEGSRVKIADEMGTAVTELCFPAGNYSEALISRCKAAGYTKVYTSIPGNKTIDFVQGRCIAQDLDTLGFRGLLHGGMVVLQTRYLMMMKFGN